MKGFSIWSNDFYVGAMQLVAPALKAKSKIYPKNPWSRVFFVNAFSMHAYLFAKISRATGVGSLKPDSDIS